MDRNFLDKDGKIYYVLSDDQEFDVVRLRNRDGSPFIEIIDRITGQLVKISPQKYRHLFSGCFEEMVKILNALIRKNVMYSRAEIIEDLMRRVEYDVEQMKNSLHLVTYRGYVELLPPGFDSHVGDAVILNYDNGLYICIHSDGKEDVKWKRLLCEDDLDNYYTKEEFDRIYVDKFKTISSYVAGDIDLTVSACEEKFIKKADVDERLSSALEYKNATIAARQFIEEQQARVDQFVLDYNAIHEEFDRLARQSEDIINAWKNIQESRMMTALQAISSHVDEFCERMTDRAEQAEEMIHQMKDDIALVSGAYIRAKNGQPKVLGEGREI